MPKLSDAIRNHAGAVSAANKGVYTFADFALETAPAVLAFSYNMLLK